PASRRARTAKAIRAGLSSELLQEAQVVVVEEAQVGDAVLKHHNTLNTQTPNKTLNLLGIVAIVVDVGVDVGVDLAGAEDLQPTLALADVAAAAVLEVTGAVALKARDVDLDQELGEGEEVRAQAHVALLAEHHPRERQQRAL